MKKHLTIRGLAVKERLARTDSWQVAMRTEGPHTIYSFDRSERGTTFEIGQRAVRDAFLKIATPEDAFVFFRKHGPFQRKDNPQGIAARDLARNESASDVQFARLVAYQEVVIKFIKTPVPKCFDKATFEDWFDLNLFRSPDFQVKIGFAPVNGTKEPAPYLQQYSYDVYSAIFSSLWIEKMAGLKGAICEHCATAFLSDTDRPRRFCDDKCADANRQARRALRKKLAAESAAEA